MSVLNHLRAAIIVVQWSVGILNAHGLVKMIDAGEWLFAALSGVVVLIVASWKIPPKAE